MGRRIRRKVGVVGHRLGSAQVRVSVLRQQRSRLNRFPREVNNLWKTVRLWGIRWGDSRDLDGNESCRLSCNLMLDSLAPTCDSSHVSSCPMDSMRVLVVDDDPDVLDAVAAILSSAGFSVACLKSAAQAKRALATQTFHLVLTDLYLEPEGLGFEIASAATECQPPVPAILLTGRPSFDSAQEAMRQHFHEMVVKPLHPGELLAACRRVIQNQAMLRRQADLMAQNRILAHILPRAIEAKDPTTSGHAERVITYADELAIRCGVSAKDRDSLRMAALLHDIGKIAVPEQILCKNGPLTSEEREVIKRHPQVGYEILSPIRDSEDIRTWVYQHHERWDGRGYPNNLRGEEVALPGRILILAEVYDALAEARSYKAPWEPKQIAEYFREQAGQHFDPELAHLVADGVERQGRRFFMPKNGQLF